MFLVDVLGFFVVLKGLPHVVVPNLTLSLSPKSYMASTSVLRSLLPTIHPRHRY